ncbi:hypothetical protein D0T57_03115 [Dysgonomonas sp. 511]|nr:hypothetical protein [Dysgonomonas sp. 511]
MSVILFLQFYLYKVPFPASPKGSPLIPLGGLMSEAMTRERESNNKKVTKMCYKCYFLRRYKIPVDELTSWFPVKHKLVSRILFTCI